MQRVAAVACALTVVLAAPATAAAHAFLKRSEPAGGSVVRTAPTEVRLVFDEPVRPAETKVLRGGGQSVAAGKPYVPAGKPNEIVVPLKPNLGAGPYAVTWSEIDAEDGHVISGAFIFSVGSGFAPAQAAGAQSGSGGAPLSAVVSRWLLLAGLLVAAGSVGFRVLVRRAPASAVVLAAALGVATLGALLSVLLEGGSTSTQFGHRMLIGAGVAAVGTACALASFRRPRLRLPASVIAVALLALPTATGHASASNVPRAVAVPADILHLAAAAFWIGGLVELALVEPPLRRAVARRFAPFALAAVALLGASGVVRAVNELDAFHQLWTISYGRALLVKTGVLVGVVALGWLNRSRLPRAGVAAELVLLAVVVGAVAVLTNVRPGIARTTPAQTPVAASRTVVYAGQDDDLAVGLAVSPARRRGVAVRATVLGFKGPVSGLDVRVAVDGARTRARACGSGCYAATLPVSGRPRAIAARIAGEGRPAATLRFAGPAQWPAPPATEIVRRAEQTIEELRTLVVHSRLASDAEHEVTTVYRMVAPDRLAYDNAGSSDSVIIGNKRWDRQAGGRWIESPQVPALRQPAPFWPPAITHAHVLRTDHVDGHAVWVVSFLDAATPAWFTAWVDRSSYRTLRLEMVAVAHFMHDRDGPFNAPVSIEPPAS